MVRTSFLTACAATSALGVLPLAGRAAELEENLETQAGTIYGTRPRSPSAGIATVRYDKRGVAASRAAGRDESDLRFDAYVADVVAWIGKLRADPRFSRVMLVGHSEGSLVGMLAAARAPIDAYVSLEGAGFPASVMLKRQLAQRLQPYPELEAQSDRILATLDRGTLVPQNDVPQLVVRLRSARRDREGIGCVTIVQGTHDVQATVDDGKALAAARPSATFALIENMTHVLVDDPATHPLRNKPRAPTPMPRGAGHAAGAKRSPKRRRRDYEKVDRKPQGRAHVASGMIFPRDR